MSTKTITYTNSFGEKQLTSSNTDILKKRKKENVFPEVLELMERIEKRGGGLVSINNISLELNVHPSVVSDVFQGLNAIGLLREREEDGTYKIARKIKDEDYKGTNDTQEETCRG